MTHAASMHMIEESPSRKAPTAACNPADGTLRFDGVQSGGYTFDILIPFGQAASVHRRSRYFRGNEIYNETAFDFNADNGKTRRVACDDRTANLPNGARIGLILMGPPGDADYFCGFTRTSERAWHLYMASANVLAPAPLVKWKYTGLLGIPYAMATGDWSVAAVGFVIFLAFCLGQFVRGMRVQKAASRAVDAVLDHVYKAGRFDELLRVHPRRHRAAR